MYLVREHNFKVRREPISQQKMSVDEHNYFFKPIFDLFLSCLLLAICLCIIKEQKTAKQKKNNEALKNRL